MEARDRLLETIREKALLFGHFTLSSGKKSTYYIDARRVTLDPNGVRYLAEVVLDLVGDAGVDAIGGPTLGADPIVGATIALSSLRRKPLKGFIVRKETKGHGTQKMIEGPLEGNERVVLVEDVITTGASVLKAGKAVEELGCKVEMVIAIVDRGDGGGEAIREAGYRFVPIFSLGELIEDCGFRQP